MLLIDRFLIAPNNIRLLEYVRGELDEKEHREVLEWIESSDENSVYFAQFQQNYWDMRWGARSVLIKGSFSQLQQRLRKRKVISCVAKCAAVILVFVVSVVCFRYFYVSDEVVPDKGEVLAIVPGGSRAYLQLSSGEVVSISTEKKILKEKDGISIEVCEDGEVLYNVRNIVSETQDEIFNKLIIPRGGEFVVTLNDGTRVWLNSGTEFHYPANFVAKERVVYLKGEAYFDVKRDTTRPFVVVVNDCMVRVYGTEFNINMHKAGIIQTVLVSGSVAFRKGKEEFRLQPGEKVEYRENDQSVEINQVDVNSYVAWKEGIFVFEDKSLEDIMNTLSLWYDVDVFYTTPGVKRVRLTGEMKRYKDIRELLYFFERISDVQFTIKGKVITVSDINMR